MRIVYLLVISIIFTSTANGQIKVVPIIGNPIIEKAFHKKMLEVNAPIEQNNFAQRGDCPVISENVNYLFLEDTLIIELDTINGIRYSLIGASDDFGTTDFQTDTLIYVAGNLTGADQVHFERRILGEPDVIDVFFDFVVKRTGEVMMMPAEQIQIEAEGNFCAEPTSNLPGKIVCNSKIFMSEGYGGQGQQIVYFNSGNSDENCFTYIATRFSGFDTIGIVLCDEFSVCDTFIQPIQIIGDTISIPFFEDFSTGGPFPPKFKWLEDLVFVNNTMAVNPPSVGAATFDGLNQRGSPYGGGFGAADHLTSKPIDLSQLSINDNLVLSFYYQMKGRGFLPRIQDGLIVEFLTEKNGWEQVASFRGSDFIPGNQFPPFEFHGIRLSDPDYFHNGFQFRFKNMSERTGAYGVWHLDYIWLDKGRTVINENFNDIAIVEGSGSLLEKYTAIPINQLKGNVDKELAKNVNATFYNHKSVAENLEGSQLFISETTTATSWNPFEITQSGIENNLLSQTLEFRDRTIPGAVLSNLISDIDNLSQSEDSLQIEVLQTIRVEAQNGPGVFQNDSIIDNTIIDNYFAYDDGTAERALENNGINSVIAVEYEANNPDQLEAVRFHFPRVNGNFDDQFFNLLVWTGSIGEVADAQYIKITKSTFSPDSLQGFTTYLLDSPLDIPAGKFFIGWQQLSTSSSPIPVGYDMNNPEASEYIWYNIGAEWVKFNSLINFKGALMIRPVMVGGVAEQTSIEDFTTKKLAVSVFPNPANELINFKIEGGNFEDYEINIFNNLGQSFYSGKLARQIDIQRFMDGIYFAKIRNLKTFETQFIQFIKN